MAIVKVVIAKEKVIFKIQFFKTMTTTHNFKLAMALAIALGLAGCGKPEDPHPVPSASYEDSVVHSPFRNAANTVTARPTSLSSNETTFGTYANFRGVDIDGNTTLTITGSGFGTTTGSVVLSDANYTVSSISIWSDTRIVLRTRTTITGVIANRNVTVTVRPVSNQTTTRNAGSMNVALCPTLYSRQFQQCTWWTTARRIDTRRSVQPRGQSYSAISGSINNDYVPQTGDVWLFGTAHQSYVETASSSTIDEFERRVVNGRTTNVLVSRLTTFVVNVSEYNIRPEAYSSYTTTVKIRTNVSSRAKTRVSGSFRSNYGSEATRFFR